MKKLLTCCMLFLLWTVLQADKSEAAKNEFGGKTIEFNFQNDENNPPSTVLKIIVYMDSNEKMVKRETFYAEKFAQKEGFDKMVDYFGADGGLIKRELYKNGNIIKSSAQ